MKLYDPIAVDKFRQQYNHPQLRWCTQPLEAAEGSDAICLLTAWGIFHTIDLHQVAISMRRPVLIDGRNVYSKEQILGTGLEYHSIGRPHMSASSRHTTGVVGIN